MMTWCARCGPTRVDRRRFLQASASGVVLLGIGALLPNGLQPLSQACRAAAVPQPARVRDADRSLAERLLGVAGLLGAGPGQVDVGATCDGLVASLDAEAAGTVAQRCCASSNTGRICSTCVASASRASRRTSSSSISAGWMNSTLGVRRTVFRVLKAARRRRASTRSRVPGRRSGTTGRGSGVSLSIRAAAAEPLVPLDDMLASRR